MRYLVLNISLGLSIFFAAALLLTDAELWAVAPDHAYALILLTVVDGVLLYLVLRRNLRAISFTRFWGALKAVLLMGDILTAPQYGLPYVEFAAYLFGLWAFTGLFLSQIVIAVSAFAYLRTKRA